MNLAVLEVRIEKTWKRIVIGAQGRALKFFWEASEKFESNNPIFISQRSLSPGLNILLPAVPVAWVMIPHWLTLTLCFISLTPPHKLLDFAAEKLLPYCKKDFGDLLL
ncbi:hypothetical protein K435DRAFT_789322 [Dendrothele bispora CBS 962.96]|uniref:Uncharacterized protein n=1 Tax=Dendrothele bispora (strain CBS 962.96) TaxID=1314807 RepID=A0A4S8MU54_DENBC|nr:hypothetical protein K435DRAFT_789322 [Dendrothele bispora CBS 962.96]